MTKLFRLLGTNNEAVEVSPITDRKPRLFHGYIVVMACLLIMAAVHGAWVSFGVFFNPLLAHLGSSRAALSGASSFGFLIMGSLAIIAGALGDRIGPRVVMTAAGLLVGIGYLLMSRVDSLWQVYLFLGIVGIGQSATDVVPLAMVVRWFLRKRSTMSGIMKVGTGLGMMGMPLLASMFITAFDWRNSYIIVAVIILATVIPFSQLLRRDPQQIGQQPDGDGALAAGNQNLGEKGLLLREALHTRQFWMVCGFYITLLFVTQTVMVHIVPHAVDIEIPAIRAASIVSMLGASSIMGRLAMGFAGDRMGSKRGMIVCFVVLIAALFWLQFAGSLWMLYLFAGIYGFSHGGFFALISPMIAGLFGTRSQGVLLGIVIFIGTVGGAVGPVMAGRLFDINGDYRLAFLILLIVGLVSLTLVASLKPIGRESK
ncbi:MAG: MFS transporter [Chloroflexi bacterium]|nr:MFS transporter [Chloroflexota bacterium]